MTKPILRTAFLSVSLVFLGALVPGADADDVHVDVTTTPVCVADTTSGDDACDLPGAVPGAEVTVGGTCVGVLADCRP